MNWQLAIFDFDGVLFDSRASALELVDELRLLSPFGSLPSPTEVGHFGELYRGRLRHSLLRFGLDAGESQEFFDRHAAGMRERALSVTLFPGAASMISSLPMPYYIVTSSYGTVVAEAFSRAGVHVELDRVMGHEIRATKSAKIASALEVEGVSAASAVYVGDMESDILYCRNVPIDCIAASYGYHPREILEAASPFALVDSVDDLAELLKGNQ